MVTTNLLIQRKGYTIILKVSKLCIKNLTGEQNA